MALYEEWLDKAQAAAEKGVHKEFWKEYYDREKNNYAKILSEKKDVLDGTVEELASYFGMDTDEFTGFLDGMNTSVKEAIEPKELEADSHVHVEIDFEKLYYEMHNAKADWLYNLTEWDNILTEEKRKEITRQYRADKTVVVGPKVGRNDPCPCGSGKKYKNCHGKKA